MIKNCIVYLLAVSLALGCKPSYTNIGEGYLYQQAAGRENKKWKLVWQDNFSSPNLDTTKWVKIPPNDADWGKHMTDDERCYSIAGGMLHLKGINNPDTTTEKRPFLTGGIYSKGKFAFQYGKIEIRAKLGCASGAWPAIWLLAEKDKYGAYPKNGEIDIMEHLNYDSIIYQTTHSYYTLNLKQTEKPPHYSTAPININDFNVFGIKWTPEKIVFILNGVETFTYPRLKDVDPSQWPYDQPFYLLIDQQLGGGWVGKVSPETLPVEMIVDWVKLYQ
jgi:beta-glucanase (GH16 family)